MHSRKGLAARWTSLVLVVPLIVASASPASAQLNRPGVRRAPGASRVPFASADAVKQTERIRTFDVIHIKGELTIDTKESQIRGTVTHTITPLYPGMNTLAIDCASELKVSKVAVKGKDQAKATDCKFEHKKEVLTVTLDRSYKPDETFDVMVTYSGSPKKGIYFIAPNDETPGQPICVWTQGESQETRHWLPCYDHPNERATSEMIVTVPRPMAVLSNGALIETKDNDDKTTTYHWKMDVPHSSYLISLAASEFTIVHDKAGSTPVDYYVLKTIDEATARRAMGHTPRMIEFFERKTGQPYPYAKYAQVIVPEFTNGGMENITATTLNEYILGDEISYLELDSDSLIAHELAHQWFGDLVTCRDWAHIWLNEGFASYFDNLYLEHNKGEEAFRLKMDQEHRSYMAGDQSVRRSIVESRYQNPDDLFEGVTYAKGASVLNSLRGLIGDEAWWRGIKNYLAEHKYHVVDTDDFKKVMEKASGRDLGWFFDQWVYHGGHPELKASWRYEPEDQTVRLKVEQTQTVDDLTPLFRLPTTAELADESGARNVPIVIDGKSQEFVIPSSSKPKSVQIDPKGWWTKELAFERSPEEYDFILEHSQDVLARLDAARKIRTRGGAKAGELLTSAWSREHDPQARAELIRLASQLQGEKARSALLDAARDRDAHVRIAAFNALADLKLDSATESLFRAAWADPREAYSVRRTALRGLVKGKVEDRKELLTRTIDVKSYKDTLAAGALTLLLSEEGAKSRETAVLYSRPGRPPALRRAAIQALSRLAKDDKEVASALTDLINDPSRSVRRSVWFALAQNNVQSALPVMEEQLKKEPVKDQPTLEGAIGMLKRQGQRRPARTPLTAPAATPAADNKAEVAELERQAAELELQVKELRNKAEALKLKDERAKLGPPKPASAPSN
jgi:aminopeptidase N